MLLWWDPFDHYASYEALVGGGYDTDGEDGHPTPSTTGGAFGGGCLPINPGESLRFWINGSVWGPENTSKVLHVSFRVRRTGASPAEGGTFLSAGSDEGLVLSLVQHPNNTLSALTHLGQVLGTTTETLSTSDLQRLELRLASGPGGSLEVRLDGVQIISYVGDLILDEEVTNLTFGSGESSLIFDDVLVYNDVAESNSLFLDTFFGKDLVMLSDNVTGTVTDDGETIVGALTAHEALDDGLTLGDHDDIATCLVANVSSEAAPRLSLPEGPDNLEGAQILAVGNVLEVKRAVGSSILFTYSSSVEQGGISNNLLVDVDDDDTFRAIRHAVYVNPVGSVQWTKTTAETALIGYTTEIVEGEPE